VKFVDKKDWPPERHTTVNEKPASPEDKILLATIDCIEKYGISGATNRRITAAAGVNLAAINYYFRSKEALVQRAIEATLKNAFDLDDMPPMPGASPAERCTSIFVDLAQGGYRYPGLTRAHFYGLLAEGKPDERLVQRVNRFIDDLAADLAGRGCTLPGSELKTALAQIFAAVMLPVLASQLFGHLPALNLRDPERCREYVARLVSRLLI